MSESRSEIDQPEPSGWPRASTLTERIATLKATGEARNFETDNNAANQRMEAWQKQEPFNKGEYFTRMLASRGVSPEDFLRTLGEPVPTPSALPWIERLKNTYSNAGLDPFREPQEAPLSFLHILGPIVKEARLRLQDGIATLAAETRMLPFDSETVAYLLTPTLGMNLLQMADRTLTLELNVARLSGTLRGETPQERYQSFVSQMRQPDRALAWLEEYPVLARQLLRAADQWISFSFEFLQRLTNDWQAICATFHGGTDPGQLAELSGGKGDSHRRGRSVLIAAFSSGFKLVYKPRSMALDQHFQDLLIWLNERGDHPPFRTLKLLDRRAYGWVEFVDYRSCTNAQELRRFYTRQGGFVALLYALNATDIHAENLIAQGEQPVLLDLEALFHGHLRTLASVDASSRLARKAMESSVLRTGLLPQRVWSSDESEGVDVSAMASSPEQLSPQPVPLWQGGGTDEMRLVRQRVPIGLTGHRPQMAGEDANVLDFAEDIVTGFKSIYRLLEKHRLDLVSESGPLACFADDEVRTILRATQTYGAILRESYHPDMLRDALDRDLLFDRLWMQVEQLPYLSRAIHAELDDLHQGDVPVFTSRPSSCDLWTSTNDRIPGFFEESSLSSVYRTLEQFGDRDLDQQLWFVNAALATVSMETRSARIAYAAPTPVKASPERLIAAARIVGDRLERTALREDGVATWIGLTQPSERYWTLSPLGIDLYDGVSGVALFLGYLGFITGEDRYESLAKAAIRGMREGLDAFRAGLTSIGGFDGWGGLIYTFTHLSQLWRDPELLQEAEAAVALLPPLIERDESLDLISGASGCIGGLLTLYSCNRSEHALKAARQCGERLLAQAKSMPAGIAWLTLGAKQYALSGFAHGTAGMAWALLELSEATGDSNFRTAALQAIEYERSLFSPENRNWLDLRHLNNGSGETAGRQLEVCSAAWCHGAPGIGLARVDALHLLDDAAIRSEIRIAMATTFERGFGLNHCLCHGDLGNLMFLSKAGDLAEAEILEGAQFLASAIAERCSHTDWLCGNPMQAESPGLMTGLAGIGYGLLNLAEPARVPCVLTLEPPRRQIS